MPFSMLSKGEQQNVLIARALMSEPQILVLDEPGTGLDVLAREEMLQHVNHLAETTKITIIYVTHYPEEIQSCFDHCLLLQHGKVLAQGTIQDIFQDGVLSDLLQIPVHGCNKNRRYHHFRQSAERWESLMTSIRDLTCIHSVAHMTEYGKYEEEFIVYGCCSKENGKLLYRISPDYKELATFAQNAIFTEQYPSPIHTAMNRCVVQAGQKETLLYETELRLAASLQCMYPQLFFDEIDKCVVVKSSDAARSIFLQLQTQMNGIFSLDYLQLFEGLLQMAYQAKLLTKPTLTTIQAWVQKMQKQMACDVVIMKPLERTFYGFCYQNSNGAYCYKMNAQEYAVLQEQRKIKSGDLLAHLFFIKHIVMTIR